MNDIPKYGKFKPSGKQNKKKQIILCHTSREVGNFLTSLEFRYNGNYDKIPNYIIDKKGNIIKLLEDNEYSNHFDDINVNRNSITIFLENLGWLEKKPLTEEYINWIGDIYKGQVYQKKWRDYVFWDPYTDLQFETTAKLCIDLIKKHRIFNFSIGHNTKIDNIQRVFGVVTRSNFDTYYTDLNPSFDFEKLQNLILNGELT